MAFSSPTKFLRPRELNWDITKRVKVFWLFYYTNPVSEMHLEFLVKRHVIASDSLYYHNSSKLIGFRFMEKYANVQGNMTHISLRGNKSSLRRIHLIAFDYWAKCNYLRYMSWGFWRSLLDGCSIWYTWFLFARIWAVYSHIFWQAKILGKDLCMNNFRWGWTKCHPVNIFIVKWR